MPSLKNNNKHTAKASLFYAQNIKRLLDNKQQRTALNSIRSEWKQQQISNNYQNEYNRIRAVIDKRVLTGNSLQHITERQAQLKKLGASAFNAIT